MFAAVTGAAVSRYFLITTIRAGDESPPGPCAVTMTTFLEVRSRVLTLQDFVPMAFPLRTRKLGEEIPKVTLSTSPLVVPLILTMDFLVTVRFPPAIVIVGGRFGSSRPGVPVGVGVGVGVVGAGVGVGIAIE